jgi:uncharacterized oxidoreductase
MPHGEVLLPGEPEERTRRNRRANGIPIDPKTWADLLSAAAEVSVAPSFDVQDF